MCTHFESDSFIQFQLRTFLYGSYFFRRTFVRMHVLFVLSLIFCAIEKNTGDINGYRWHTVCVIHSY